jgi:hypothetical protein
MQSRAISCLLMWHIAKFCCTIEVGRNRGKPDIAGPAVGANNAVDFAETVRTGVLGCSRVT